MEQPDVPGPHQSAVQRGQRTREVRAADVREIVHVQVDRGPGAASPVRLRRGDARGGAGRPALGLGEVVDRRGDSCAGARSGHHWPRGEGGLLELAVLPESLTSSSSAI